jgi:DnaJ-like protein C11, C-terminal
MNKRFMSFSFFWVLTAAVLFSTSAAAQNQAAVMPGPGWQVIKADWGSGNRWMDVTNRVRVLLSGNGMVQVTNSNLGGDPAVGADKVLRIQARNFQGQSRQFSFKEGGSIDASQFYNYGGGIGGGGGGNAPGWQVMWADWGSGNRRMDVTNRVRALLSGNGMVKVNNANLGADPAVGADKVLRISARDMQGQTRQFSYKEGSNIDASQFYNYGGGGYPGNPGNPGYPGNPGIPGGGNGNLQIVRAYYGLNNRTNDVTQLLRGRVQNGTLVIQVNNNNMGGDPAVGGDKVLTVIYRYQGREQTSTVKEGNTLRIP